MIAIPFVLLLPGQQGFPPVEPINRARFVDFGGTFAPVTPQNVWTTGRDVTRNVRLHRAEVYALLRSAGEGRFDPQEVRLGIALDSGLTLYVDNGGGVRTRMGDRKLSEASLKALKRFVPKIVFRRHLKPEPLDFAALAARDRSRRHPPNHKH